MATTPNTSDTSRDPRAGGKGAGGDRRERRGRDGGCLLYTSDAADD
jgi:hypothetical protein